MVVRTCIGCGERFAADEMINTRLPKKLLRLCLECTRDVMNALHQEEVEQEERELFDERMRAIDAEEQADKALMDHVRRLV